MMTPATDSPPAQAPGLRGSGPRFDGELARTVDDLVAFACQMSECPVALVSLVDAGRPWFRPSRNLADRATARDWAAFVDPIVEPARVLTVLDACMDERFAAHPLVLAPPHLRFFLGVPVMGAEGRALGTVCIGDDRARSASAALVSMLNGLARGVALHLELRGARCTPPSTVRAEAPTDLPNRQALLDLCASKMTNRDTVAVLALDLDLVEQRHDTHGQAAGDAVLRATALRLLQHLRTGEAAFRVDGNAFVVLLNDVAGESAAIAAAGRFWAALHASVPFEDTVLRPEVSIGLAVGPAQAAEMLLASAERALERGKREAPGGIARATPQDR